MTLWFLAHWSQTFTRWAYSIARLCCTSSWSTLLNKYISRTDFSQNLSIASLGWGKGWIRFWGRSDKNCGYHGSRKLPLTYNGENAVSAFSQIPLIGSSSNLQVTRTGIKSRMSSNLGRVGLFTTKLFVLERSHWLLMGQMMSPSFLSKYKFSLQKTRAWNVGWVRIPAGSDLSLWSYMPLRCEKNDVSSFS